MYLTHENETTVVDMIPFAETENITCSASDLKERQSLFSFVGKTEENLASRKTAGVDTRHTATSSGLVDKVAAPKTTVTDMEILGRFSRRKLSAPTQTTSELQEPATGREIVDSNSQPAVIQIRTSAEGFNSGRTYYLRCPSRQLSSELANSLRSLAAAARRSAEVKTKFRRSQELVRHSARSTKIHFCCSILLTSPLRTCVDWAGAVRVQLVSVSNRRVRPYFPGKTPQDFLQREHFGER